MIKNKCSLEEAKNKYFSNLKKDSIGVYQEKAIHGILKNYFETDDTKKEVKVSGSIADIKNEYGIIEIQTRSFDKLRPKLDKYLIDNEVTIVYPLFQNKTIIWLNSDNEKDYNRKSSRHQNIYNSFKELYKLKTYLTNPHLHLHFVYLEAIEFKNLDGFGKDNKKHASTFNKLPINIISEEDIESYNDFKYLLNDVNGEFTVNSLAKLKHINKNNIAVMITIFSYLGLIKKVGTLKRAYVYTKNF